VRAIGLVLVWISLPVGTAAAAAALYGRYRTLPAFLTGPAICRLEANGCAVLFRTPLAAIVGVPNSLLGLIFYPLVAIGLLLHWAPQVLIAASTLALAMTSYLALRLIRDHLECRICWVGHIANGLLWIGLFMWSQGKAL
jgi:uncharacterized membrane protein